MLTLVFIVVMAGYLLVGCENDRERSRSALVRNYLGQNWNFGESLESYPIPATGGLLWSHTMDPSQAGAIAGALGLEWPLPLSDFNGPKEKSFAWAYCSWNWRYCLLALTGHDSQGGQPTRFCLMDTTGHVGWTRDLASSQHPVISDLGTVALFAMTRYPVERQLNELGLEIALPGSKQWADTTYRREYNRASRLAFGRDSLITTFVDTEGEILGSWACPRSELITSMENHASLGVFAFMPDSERLFMLTNPRKKAPWDADTARQYIRCLRTDGSVAWQYDLGESSAGELAYPGNHRVIAFGTRKVDDRLLSSESRLYDNELFLFNMDGDIISHIERRCPEEIDHLWLVTQSPYYLYFLSNNVEVLDLQSGGILTQVPLRPLYDKLSKGRNRCAERFIRRQLGLSLRDTIPPLE